MALDGPGTAVTVGTTASARFAGTERATTALGRVLVDVVTVVFVEFMELPVNAIVGGGALSTGRSAAVDVDEKTTEAIVGSEMSIRMAGPVPTLTAPTVVGAATAIG
jgi:hypothetical protein